jgi:putative holliday junction resolvase
MSDPLPTSGRLAGIDYGTVRIGVAISDPGQTLASPLENYTRRTLPLDTAWFQRLAAEERIAGFVVGLPVFSSGDESPKSREARDFGAWLAQVTQRPVQFFDERYSSAIAEGYLGQAKLTKKRRQQRLDKLAAQVILASYLEARASGTTSLLPKSLDDRP